MSIQLQEAMRRAKSFAELIPIAKQLKPELTWYGHSYVVAPPSNGEIALKYDGKAHISSLVTRAFEIITEHRSSRTAYAEKNESLLLDNEIQRIYDKDDSNYKNSKIAWIFVTIKVIFRLIFSVVNPRESDYPNYQECWNTNNPKIYSYEGHLLAEPTRF